MNPPTVSDIKSWSRVNFTELDAPFTDADLTNVVIPRATDYVANVTGRLIDATMPPPLTSIAEDAIQKRVEQVAYQSQPDYVETGADDQIQTFSAGDYSETRHETTGRYRGVATGYPQINSWAALNNLLWLLMTSDQQDYWRSILQGINAPAFDVTEVDWSNFDGLYPNVGWPSGVAPATDPFLFGA